MSMESRRLDPQSSWRHPCSPTTIDSALSLSRTTGRREFNTVRQFKGNESFVKFRNVSRAVIYSDLRLRQKFLRSCDMITLTVDGASEESSLIGITISCSCLSEGENDRAYLKGSVEDDKTKRNFTFSLNLKRSTRLKNARFKNISMMEEIIIFFEHLFKEPRHRVSPLRFKL